MRSTNLIMSFESPVHFQIQENLWLLFGINFYLLKSISRWCYGMGLPNVLLQAQSLFLELDYSPEVMFFTPLLANLSLPYKVRFLFWLLQEEHLS